MQTQLRLVGLALVLLVSLACSQSAGPPLPAPSPSTRPRAAPTPTPASIFDPEAGTLRVGDEVIGVDCAVQPDAEGCETIRQQTRQQEGFFEECLQRVKARWSDPNDRNAILTYELDVRDCLIEAADRQEAEIFGTPVPTPSPTGSPIT